MITSADRNWRFGPTAMTLLATYMLVLQSLVIGVGAATPGASGLFAKTVCVSKRANPADGPVSPGGGGHADACCAFHFAGTNAPPPRVVALAPPVRVLSAAIAPQERRAAPIRVATPPLGSRAPPTA